MELTRVPNGKMIAGVCTGLAKYLRVDVSLVRIITVLLAVFTQVGWIIYLALWLIVPEEGSKKTGIDGLKDTFESHRNSGGYQQYPGPQQNGPQDPPAAS